jgi:acyl dehydratase
MTDFFDSLQVATRIDGPPYAVSRESIREFCEASLDFNPLHLDDDYAKGRFGRTTFGGIIMHGMNNFGLLTRMLTDWAYEGGGIHRRLETRWLVPVKPGDTIRPAGEVKAKQRTEKSRWVTVSVEVTNQRGEAVASGEALIEFPTAAA